MSSLSDAEKKAFIDRTIASLADNQALLVSAGWDPGQRIRNLQNGISSVANDENVISQLGVALKAAVDTRRNDLENNFNLASVTVNLIEDVLGSDHLLVSNLHRLNGGASGDAPRR